ncbi:MAG: ParB N-terminal domain-containing protein [Candidatus Methanomethylicia archaeon]
MSSYWCLSFLNFNVKLTLVSPYSVYAHEEVIPSLLDKLVMDIESIGLFKDPIIVDGSSNVVLDGMHRLAAAKKLGLFWIPVCYIDYMDERVKVYRWWRSIFGYDLKKVVEHSFKMEFKDNEMLNDYLSKFSLLVFKDGFYILSYDDDVFSKFMSAKNLERFISNSGFRIEYDFEVDAISKLRSGLCSAILTLPEISKVDVISIAVSNRVLPHKSTRHVFPYRPMNINVPLKILFIDDFEKAFSMFIEVIKGRRVNIYPPGHILDRKYDEYIYFFEG